MQTDLQRKCR